MDGFGFGLAMFLLVDQDWALGIIKVIYGFFHIIYFTQRFSKNTKTKIPVGVEQILPRKDKCGSMKKLKFIEARPWLSCRFEIRKKLLFGL